MTDQMKKVLTRAAGNLGVTAGGQAFYEAQKNGWIGGLFYNQNSTTARFRITDAGRKALEEAA